ncbi:MAG: hypothetical protein JW725_01660 [Candidatus Babeliaceae bacterium]|nr:hypothetical protein [Candidatus Babeliaceae bacterium]
MIKKTTNFSLFFYIFVLFGTEANAISWANIRQNIKILNIKNALSTGNIEKFEKAFDSLEKEAEDTKNKLLEKHCVDLFVTLMLSYNHNRKQTSSLLEAFLKKLTEKNKVSLFTQKVTKKNQKKLLAFTETQRSENTKKTLKNIASSSIVPFLIILQNNISEESNFSLTKEVVQYLPAEKSFQICNNKLTCTYPDQPLKNPSKKEFSNLAFLISIGEFPSAAWLLKESEKWEKTERITALSELTFDGPLIHHLFKEMMNHSFFDTEKKLQLSDDPVSRALFKTPDNYFEVFDIVDINQNSVLHLAAKKGDKFLEAIAEKICSLIALKKDEKTEDNNANIDSWAEKFHKALTSKNKNGQSAFELVKSNKDLWGRIEKKFKEEKSKKKINFLEKHQSCEQELQHPVKVLKVEL